MIPIETVVELLLENYCPRDNGDFYVLVPGGSVSGVSREHLRVAIREHLQHLVPAPKLLSECEEGNPYVVDLDGRWTVLCRVGKNAFGYPKRTGTDVPFCPANTIKAIQPVEVNRE